MATAVRITDELVREAKIFSKVYQMSITLSGSRQLSCPVFYINKLLFECINSVPFWLRPLHLAD